MNDLMQAYDWQIDVQAFLPIPGTKYELSVVPEYTYWYRDDKGFLNRSKIPQGTKLNCCVMVPYDGPEGKFWRPEMQIDITCEEEFYDFMISMKKDNVNLENSL
jgi:hypothetical protein